MIMVTNPTIRLQNAPSSDTRRAPHKIRQMHAAGFPFEEDMLTAPHATEDDNFEEF